MSEIMIVEQPIPVQNDCVHEIAPGLWLGNGNSRIWIKELKINLVIQVAQDEKELAQYPEIKHPSVQVETVWLCDDRNSDLPIEKVIQIFDQVSKGQILLHCQMGTSRSVSLFAALAMSRLGWNLDQAITNIRVARKSSSLVTRPNVGFARQLLKLERNLGNGKNSTTLSDILLLK